jgi:hypothetical protein
VATALDLAAANGYPVTGWEYNAEVVEEINRLRTNTRYLPGVRLHDRLAATTDLAAMCRSAQVIFIALPMRHVQRVLDLLDELLFVAAAGLGLDQHVIGNDVASLAAFDGARQGRGILHGLVRIAPPGDGQSGSRRVEIDFGDRRHRDAGHLLALRDDVGAHLARTDEAHANGAAGLVEAAGQIGASATRRLAP